MMFRRRWSVALYRKDFTLVSRGKSFMTHQGARRYAQRMNATHTAESTRWLVVMFL